MITTGAKFFFGLGVAAIVAAAVYGFATDGGLSGVLTVGLLGGVGELVGYTVLLFVGVASLTLGGVTLAFRDADAEAIQRYARTAVVPEATPAAGLSPWPIVAAFGAAVTVLGLVISSVLFVIGLVVIGIAAIEWLIQAWADRATGDPAANAQIRNRLMYPIEIPLAGAIVIALGVAAFSRILLALPQEGSTAIAIAVAALIVALGALVATREKVSKNLIVGLLLIAAIAVLAGGITAAAVGERETEPHEEEQDEGPAEGGLGTLVAPLGGWDR